MTEPSFDKVCKYIKIPVDFYNSDTGRMFTNCISCDRDILKPGIQYVIEKAVKQYPKYNTQDIIFEYAMCIDCTEIIKKSFSDVSIQKIEQYYDTHTDMIFRRKKLLEENKTDHGNWISHCLVKGTPREQLSEYQIVCQCNGDMMFFTYLPFMIGGEALEELAQLLSNKTLGEIDRFYQDFFPIPPEFKSLFDDHKVLII